MPIQIFFVGLLGIGKSGDRQLQDWSRPSLMLPEHDFVHYTGEKIRIRETTKHLEVCGK